MPCPFCGGFGYGGGPLGLLLGFIFILALLAGIGLLIWWLVRSSGAGRPTGPGQSRADSAIRILDERFARGEIGEEEYEERRRTLTGS